jgi:small conductance mechanosensitive channel
MFRKFVISTTVAIPIVLLVAWLAAQGALKGAMPLAVAQSSPAANVVAAERQGGPASRQRGDDALGGADRAALAQQRFEPARADVGAVPHPVGALQADLADLNSDGSATSNDATANQGEADPARKNVAQIQNPFSPQNLLQWLLDNGLKIVLILASMWVLHWLVGVVSRRIVKVVARTTGRGTAQERENRAHTLVGVFRNVAAIIIFGGGALMLLDAVGVPIAPLMGGAAVFGLAVAFGAQNLIRDYFSGFMVLLENQYGVNDVVKIGDHSGLVEKITLRMTVLRDLEGVVHFIPHGTINTVSNFTHVWSRALFDVAVAYKEDVDRVMQVLVDLAKELRTDPVLGPEILDDPEMLGVDALGDSAVVIKFFIKTRPLKQWLVKRELLRRIKRRFDELSIEIPFPQRTLHLRYDEGGRPSPPPHAPPWGGEGHP